MDIGKYQSDRDSELKAFQKEYNDLKTQYNTLLSRAVYETDTGKQADLVKQVLSINSGLAQHVRDFVQASRGKFDPALISELTADIIRYQKEFEAIQTSSDKAVALKNVLDREKNQLNTLHSQFDLYLGVLLGGIVLILILIFRTSLIQLQQAAESLVSSISTPEMGDSSGLGSDETLYKISPI
jgi:hypothetical protein